MRVVVHHPARTEEDGTAVPESVAAFRQGRIEDFVNPLTGETTPRDEVAAILLAQAQEAHPDKQVKVEHLHIDEESNTSEWKDHPPESAAPPGEQHAQDLSAEQGQEVAQ